jgi:hypothetical protein
LRIAHNISNTRTGRVAACLLPLLLAVGCSDLNWPFHHPGAPVSAAPGEHAGDNGDADECASIRAQIRENEESRREAPTTTTDSDIVNAAQGKADKRIDDLRQRADAMDCAGDSASGRSIRQPPLQPAPGGGNK